MSNPATKPPPVFELEFKGPGIYPWSIPISKVTGAISAIKRIVAGDILAEEDEDEDQPGDETITLLQVKRGSAVYQFAAQPKSLAKQRFTATGNVLHNPEEVGQSEYVLRPIKDLSIIARVLECSILIKEPGKGSHVFAEVHGESYSELSKSLIMTGETSITGKVLRVGGATDVRCGLRVPFQSRMLFCKVDGHEVAKKLGDFLYQRVVVQGAAKWLKNSMRLFSFTIKDVYEPKSASIINSLDSIWEAGMKEWEKLEDPDAYFQEMHGED